MNTLTTLKSDVAPHGLTLKGTAEDVGFESIELLDTDPGQPCEWYAFLVEQEGRVQPAAVPHIAIWRWQGAECYALFKCDDYPDVAEKAHRTVILYSAGGYVPKDNGEMLLTLHDELDVIVTPIDLMGDDGKLNKLVIPLYIRGGRYAVPGLLSEMSKDEAVEFAKWFLGTHVLNYWAYQAPEVIGARNTAISKAVDNAFVRSA